MGQRGGHGYPLLRHDQYVRVVVGNILNGEHLDKIVGALAGDGRNGGKTKGRRVAHGCHAILSQEFNMPPKDSCASGEDKKETVGQSNSN